MDRKHNFLAFIKSHLFPCFTFLLVVLIAASTLAVVPAVADKTPWDKRGLEHRCDVMGEDEVAKCLTTGFLLAESGTVAEVINDGYMVAYVDTFKAYGLLPSDFTPTAKSTAPAATKSEPAAAKKPTFTESEPVAYVTVKSCEVYDNYDGGKKTGSVVEADTEVTLNGASSNGFYRMEDGTFVEKSGVVLKDKYDAAWSVTEETPATCTEAGYVKKSNSLSGKESEETVDALGHKYEKTDVKEPTCTEDGYNTFVCSVCGDTYTEDLQALGHEAGEPEVTVAPKTFSKGTQTTYCTVCGEVLSEEAIPQTFPVPLGGVIVIAVAVAGVVAAVVVVVVKKKRK